MSATGKPRLRGVSHEIAFFVSLAGGPALMLLAPTIHARLAVALYASTLSGLFGVSALLHRRTWSLRWRRWLRRLDHAMIFLAIAGTYTAIGGLTLAPDLATIVLRVVWIGALGGALLHLAWVDIPKWLGAIPYVALGWVAVVAMPELRDRLGAGGMTLLVGGGALYTLGAFVYARRRPDPFPTVFGYHEIFHLLVIAAATAHYATLAAFVLPRLTPP